MMASHDKDGVHDTGHAELASPPDKVIITRGEERRRRASTPLEGDAAILSRETSATRREDAALIRENAANVREDTVYLREGAAQVREGEAYAREGSATSREVEIRAAERLHVASRDHMTMLRQANASLVIASVAAHQLTEQVLVAKAEMDYLAHHDVLTALPNRLLLQDRLRQALELARRQGGQLAVMFIDLDQFKHINDSLGHPVGDQLLRSVAQRLVGCMRQSDTVSRQGGDEFVLLLPSIQQAEEAARSAQKVLAAFALPHAINHNDLYVTLSIGISIFPDNGADVETLLKSADTAMYYAKENGRNTYKFFEPGMSVRAVHRQFIETSLHRALERQEFVLHYQPKINLESGMVVGVEALIRWQHPELGLLPPTQFIPIAEDCGLILPIGRWVLRKACRQAQAWRQAGAPPIVVAVNTSALEFRAQDFIENIRATLDATGLEPGCLELELTESVLMRDVEATQGKLHALAGLGVRLTVDDFGTGYSSLSYLRQFPINALKIDQSFVHQISHNPDDASLVSAVINMGKNLKRRVIAEGVETAEQYAFLLAQQCDEGQGFYFGHPMVAEEFAIFWQKGLH